MQNKNTLEVKVRKPYIIVIFSYENFWLRKRYGFILFEVLSNKRQIEVKSEKGYHTAEEVEAAADYCYELQYQ